MEETQPFPRISVVIPALNEAPNLRHVIPLIPWFVHEIILVDGDSTDGTITVNRATVRNYLAAHSQSVKER